jgi:hypothetical protein
VHTGFFMQLRSTNSTPFDVTLFEDRSKEHHEMEWFFATTTTSAGDTAIVVHSGNRFLEFVLS